MLGEDNLQKSLTYIYLLILSGNYFSPVNQGSDYIKSLLIKTVNTPSHAKDYNTKNSLQKYYSKSTF